MVVSRHTRKYVQKLWNDFINENEGMDYPDEESRAHCFTNYLENHVRKEKLGLYIEAFKTLDEVQYLDLIGI